MKTIKLYAKTGIGNQIQFIPALKILEQNDFKIYSNSQVLYDLVPELLQKDLLSQKNYDYGILLYHKGIEVGYKANKDCKKVIGFAYSFKFSGHNEVPFLSRIFLDNTITFDRNLPEIINNINLISYLNINTNNIDFSINIPRSPKTNTIGISAGSGGFEEVRWARENWTKLIEKLQDKQIKLFGLEHKLNKCIKENSNHSNVHIVKTQTIREAAIEIAKCSIFISNDNGLMHIADVLKVPLLTLFGMTNQIKSGPWSKSSKIISLNLNCSPCYKNGNIDCIYSNNKYRCMDIPISLVLENIKEMEKKI